MLPHNPDDCLHLAKKRHIGNDVVAIIFQVNIQCKFIFEAGTTLPPLISTSINQQLPNFTCTCNASSHQEEEVPFHPEMITSNLLHAFLIARPTPGGYKIAVVTRSVTKFSSSISRDANQTFNLEMIN